MRSRQTCPVTATAVKTTTANDEEPFVAADWALFMGVSVIWGASFLLIAMGLETLTAGAVTFLRVGFGAVTLWMVRVVRLASGRRPASAVSFGGDPIVRSDWSLIVLMSIVWVAVPFTLFPVAQQHINSAIAGLLNGATPVFVTVISVLATRIMPTGRQLFGIAVGFVGLILLSLPSIADGESQARGVAMVLLATVCYGVAINLAAPLQRRYGAVTLMSWVLGLATVWLIPVGLNDLDRNVWDPAAVVPVVVLGVVGTGMAYWIMSTLVGRVGSIRASLITYLIPVVSLVLGVVVRSDVVAPLALFGAVLITGGALLASRSR